MKMSKSEAGKLGAVKSREISAQIKKSNEGKYLISPKKCSHCSTILSYDDRHKKFCNSSCAVTYNNLQRGRKIAHCIHCNLLLNGRLGKFCSTKCQVDRRYKLKLESGTHSNGVIKRWLTETYGYKCMCCGIAEWNNKKIVLELEHKDGNSENNDLVNVELLCPNCHSQTLTYKAKNKGNGRHTRRIRYAQGKSY